jgi:hypothetical protein
MTEYGCRFCAADSNSSVGELLGSDQIVFLGAGTES